MYRPRVTKKWVEKTLPIVMAKTNGDLLNDTIQLAGGDDYDGCFTPRGSAMFEMCQEELRRRLTEIGFLKR